MDTAFTLSESNGTVTNFYICVFENCVESVFYSQSKGEPEYSILSQMENQHVLFSVELRTKSVYIVFDSGTKLFHKSPGAVDAGRPAVHVPARAAEGAARGLGGAAADVGEPPPAAHAEPRAAAAAAGRAPGRGAAGAPGAQVRHSALLRVGGYVVRYL